VTNRDIVWVASYPKSGNTWVRFMVCNLLFGVQESASSVAALVPDIHETAATLPEGDGARLAKTHFLFSAHHPLASRTSGAIYVVRRPEDVLVSSFHYARRSARDEAETASFERYVEEFITHRGDPRFRDLGMGTWEENVHSWLGTRHPFPVVAIRYEDLSANAGGVCRSLARLLRPQSTDDEIERAVEHSSFRRMREIEEADIRVQRVGIFYKPYLRAAIDTGQRFMRAGVAGDGAARLSSEQRARLEAAFAPTLARLGYASAAIARRASHDGHNATLP
jgi:hypothetical protein